MNPTFVENTMKTMIIMPLPTQGSKQHLTKLFLKVNKKKTFFWIFMFFYVNFTCTRFIVCECGNK